MTSLDEVGRITIPEYEIMLEAVRERNEELNYMAHWQAFLNALVRSVKKDGKPVYRKFRSFYQPPKDKQPQGGGKLDALAEYKRQKLKEKEKEENV